MQKKLLSLVLMGALLLTAGCGGSKTDGTVVGEVDGTPITQTQLDMHYYYTVASYQAGYGITFDETEDAETLKTIRDQAFEDLITYTLVEKAAKAQNIAANNAYVNEIVEGWKANLSGQGSSFKQFLTDNHIDEDFYRYELTVNNLMQQLYNKVAATVPPVTEEEITANYEVNKDSLYSQPASIQISHILVETEDEANEIIGLLDGGADFATLAQERSIDTASAISGGDVGLVNESTNFVAEFKTAALALEPGKYTENPVQSQFGYHIIKAGDRVAESTTPLADVEPNIRTQLQNDKANTAFDAYLQGLKEAATIVDKREA
jgi:peptidyl-prolyl cis-trans isomerase C/foldase protein PrsA